MADSHVSIPIPTEDFLALVDFLREQGSSRDPVKTISVAIQYWIDNASWKREDLLPELFEAQKGYRWKQLMLPHGTLLRMKYKGAYSYAKVEGDQIKYEGIAVSPSEFANTVAGSARNAWRDIEIRRPTDTDWLLAWDLRSGTSINLKDL